MHDVNGDPFRTSLSGPKRRLRGQGRYFRGVERRAASFELDVRADAWWDHWHYHADWEGWGNRGWRLRRAHLGALITVFQAIASRRAELHVPFQAWIFLSGADAGADATYLHTPNPNAENFPLRLPGIRFDSRAAAQIASKVHPLLPGIRVGELSYPDPDRERATVRDFFLFSEHVGLPLGP